MPDTPAPAPEVQTADLRKTLLHFIDNGDHGYGPDMVDDILAALERDGWYMPGIPPVRQVLADARQYSDELVLTKLVARFFRIMVLGAVIIPETPAAMDWLRDYIDGTHRVHGPLGKPMIWPGRLPAIEQLLRSWGFQPTPTNPQYVSLRPGGVMAPIDMPDPQAPDPRSVVPIAEQRERNMGALLDQISGGTNVMAVDRMTAIRAMSAAFDRGTTHYAVAAFGQDDERRKKAIAAIKPLAVRTGSWGGFGNENGVMPLGEFVTDHRLGEIVDAVVSAVSAAEDGEGEA